MGQLYIGQMSCWHVLEIMCSADRINDSVSGH